MEVNAGPKWPGIPSKWNLKMADEINSRNIQEKNTTVLLGDLQCSTGALIGTMCTPGLCTPRTIAIKF